MSTPFLNLQKSSGVVFLCLMILAGCSAPNLQSATASPTPLHGQPLPTITSTQSIATLTPAITPTITPTIPDEWITKRCLKFVPAVSGMSAENVVASNHRYDVAFLNLATGKTTPLIDNGAVAEVSPDGKWLAYYPLSARNKTQNTSITILSAEKKIYKVFPRKMDWTGFEWVNNHQILIGRADMNSDSYVPKNFVLLDIISGQQEELPYDYPDLIPPLPPIAWKHWPVVYDPTLTRVAYAKPNYDFSTVSLWDFQKSRELGTVNVINFDLYPTEPKWSSDGSRFIISASFEVDKEKSIYGDDLFSVSRDGQTNRLTYFTDASGHASSTIREYTWSSDDRYIGLWMESKDKKIWFGTLDTQTNMLTDYCLSGVLGDENIASITWSPDSKSVLVAFQDVAGKTKVVLIDVFNGLASQIVSKEGLFPIGWMLKSP